MINQPKKREKGRKNLPLFTVGEAINEADPSKPKRGRPKSSPHDAATQNRVRVQRHREAKREENEVRVDIYLPRDWHEWILNVKGANLREVAVEAFALWLEKQGYSAEAGDKPRLAKDA